MIGFGLRSAFVPQYPHLSVYLILIALVLFGTAFLLLGLRRFRKKAVSGADIPATKRPRFR